MKNFKKFLILLLALSALAFALASCGEEEYVPEGDGFFPPEEEEEDEVKDHVCIANGNVFENVVESTCTATGSYDDVYYCVICNGEIVRTTRVSELKPHDYVDGFCSVCGVEKYSEGLEIATYMSNTKYAIVGLGTCTDENIVIPSTYEGKPISYINDGVFENCDFIKSVKIPEGVTAIFEGTFRNCYNLESVSLPSTLNSIYTEAFMGCTSLKSIVLPAKVSTVGEGAFSGCTALESVTHNGEGEIGIYAFKNCTSLSNITFTGYLSSIGVYAFENCVSLEHIALPDGLKYIQGDLFAGCSNLKSVTIPESMYQIDSTAFATCEKMEVFYYKGTDWDSVWKTNVKALEHIRVEYIDPGAIELTTIPA
ncbi:MAG: leucine-rich repeat domain-containing protein [Clostridia bacterium]|nr:leucine-rich repeat domain-containing protein [Clostridia bacterium]